MGVDGPSGGGDGGLRQVYHVVYQVHETRTPLDRSTAACPQPHPGPRRPLSLLWIFDHRLQV